MTRIAGFGFGRRAARFFASLEVFGGLVPVEFLFGFGFDAPAEASWIQDILQHGAHGILLSHFFANTDDPALTARIDALRDFVRSHDRPVSWDEIQRHGEAALGIRISLEYVEQLVRASTGVELSFVGGACRTLTQGERIAVVLYDCGTTPQTVGDLVAKCDDLLGTSSTKRAAKSGSVSPTSSQRPPARTPTSSTSIAGCTCIETSCRGRETPSISSCKTRSRCFENDANRSAASI